jgi:Protein of unknown function (DUF1580)
MSAATTTKDHLLDARPADWLDELIGELKDKGLIPANRLPKILPPLRNDRPVNVSTCYRWMLEGCRGHKLKYATIGSRRFTKPEWLREFFEALNGGPAEVMSAPIPASEPERAAPTRADQETDRRLDAYIKLKSGKTARRQKAGAAPK